MIDFFCIKGIHSNDETRKILNHTKSSRSSRPQSNTCFSVAIDSLIGCDTGDNRTAAGTLDACIQHIDVYFFYFQYSHLLNSDKNGWFSAFLRLDF